MGTWGTSIFADDTAADVRDDYRDFLASGKSDAEARVLVQARYLQKEPSIRSLVEPLFWLALARAQWEVGRLDAETKEKALAILDSGAEIERWRALGASKSDIAKRTKVLAVLREMLSSHQKPRKKLRPRKQRVSPYELGDVVQFSLSTARHVLFRITSINRHREGESPVAEILDWVGTSVPTVNELSGIPCRQRRKANGQASVRYPRILLEFAGKDYEPGRFTIVARGLPVRPVEGEAFTCYAWAYFEQALADEFGLR